MRDIKQLHPQLQTKIKQLIQLCAAQGLIIGISECLRTVAEQDTLYAQGRTAPGNVVTNAKGSTFSSQHQWGVAFDFYRNEGTGAFNEDGHFFEKVGVIAKSIGLGWGGDWTSPKDRPHLYMPDWGSTTSQLKSKYGTPDKFIATWLSKPTEPIKPVKPVSPVKPTAPTTAAATSKSSFIKEVQKAIGAKTDGIPGPETLSKTVTVSKTINRRHPVVPVLQAYLNALGYDMGKVDGIAGPIFDSGIRSYQKMVVGLRYPDGEITAQKNTWRALLGMKK